jgi:hypothetical protein
MGKLKIKPNYRRRVLRLPDLDHCKLAVLNSLGSPASRRVYELPSTSSPPGTVPNRASHSTASWSSATACTWNHEVWLQIRSTNNSQPFEGSRTKPLTQAC